MSGSIDSRIDSRIDSGIDSSAPGSPLYGYLSQPVIPSQILAIWARRQYGYRTGMGPTHIAMADEFVLQSRAHGALSHSITSQREVGGDPAGPDALPRSGRSLSGIGQQCF